MIGRSGPGIFLETAIVVTYLPLTSSLSNHQTFVDPPCPLGFQPMVSMMAIWSNLRGFGITQTEWQELSRL